MTRRLRFAAILCAAATLATSGHAQQPFDLETAVQFCAVCHGKEGAPKDRQIPIIWGQQADYMIAQLQDYKAGRRDNGIMSTIAGRYDTVQMEALARSFSQKQWVRVDPRADPATAAQGRDLLAAGGCAECHGDYAGQEKTPRLAGQIPDYLTRAMVQYKNRIRLNAPDKPAMMSGYDAEQLRAMAQYLGGL